MIENRTARVDCKSNSQVKILEYVARLTLALWQNPAEIPALLPQAEFNCTSMQHHRRMISSAQLLLKTYGEKEFPSRSAVSDCGKVKVEYEKRIKKSLRQKYSGKFFTAII
jgi:hypothetical protein